MKLGIVGAEFRADGQIDITKLIVRFSQFLRLLLKTQFLPRNKHTPTTL